MHRGAGSGQCHRRKHEYEKPHHHEAGVGRPTPRACANRIEPGRDRRRNRIGELHNHHFAGMGQRRIGKRLGLPVTQPRRPAHSSNRRQAERAPMARPRRSRSPRPAGCREGRAAARFSREDRDHQRPIASGNQPGRPQRPIGRMDPGRQAAGSVPHHDGLVLGKQAGTESQRQRKPDACDGANRYQWNPRGERPSRAGAR